jgi:hypothetical protein
MPLLPFSLVLLTAVRSTVVFTHSKHQRYFFMPLLPLFFRSCSMLPSVYNLPSLNSFHAPCSTLLFVFPLSFSLLSCLHWTISQLDFTHCLCFSVCLAHCRCLQSTFSHFVAPSQHHVSTILPYCLSVSLVLPCLPSTISTRLDPPCNHHAQRHFSCPYCPCLALLSLHSFSPTPKHHARRYFFMSLLPLFFTCLAVLYNLSTRFQPLEAPCSTILFHAPTSFVFPLCCSLHLYQHHAQRKYFMPLLPLFFPCLAHCCPVYNLPCLNSFSATL